MTRRISNKKHKTIRVRTKKQRGGEVQCSKLIKAKIFGLVHGTSLSNFEKIIQTGFLKSSEGNAPLIKGLLKGIILNKGVYFQPMFTCNKNKEFDATVCLRPIMLVFSNVIMNTYNYHISTRNCGGAVFSPGSMLNYTCNKESNKIYSYTNDQIVKFFTKHDKDTCTNSSGFTQNEVVFRNDISLDYLQEVWICNFQGPFKQYSHHNKVVNNVVTKLRHISDQSFNPYETYHTIISMLHEKYSHVTVKLITKLPDKLYDKGCIYRSVPVAAAVATEAAAVTTSNNTVNTSNP